MNDYIVFTVGENYYTVSVEMVQRIIQVPELTPIPNAHESVDGMMSYESKVIKVLNFRTMMGMEEPANNRFVQSQKLLICQNGDQVFGIKVDKIEDIIAIGNDGVKQVERLGNGSSLVEVSGVVELGDHLVNVIKSVNLPSKERI